MHSTGVAIASATLAAASVFGFEFDSVTAIAILAVAVALIGVPHGALDHWTGRRLLSDRFPTVWPVVFFSAYASVSVAVVAGWWFFPTATVIGFFLVSAVHFGWEDEIAWHPKAAAKLLIAAAIGGLVIWLPLLFRPDDVGRALSAIMPATVESSALRAVGLMQPLAFVFASIALIWTLTDLATPNGRRRGVRNAGFAAMLIFADIFVSFGVYFCAWHSVRGLSRLGREHGLSGHRTIVAVLPLSAATLLLAGAGGWLITTRVTLSDALTQTLFIGLSAIAVPHLLLHGPMTTEAARWATKRSVLPVKMELAP